MAEYSNPFCNEAQPYYIPHVTMEEIFTLFETSAAMNVAVYRPQGGTSYLFKWEDNSKAEDWIDDGYRWRQGGSSSKSVNGVRVKKTYFQVRIFRNFVLSNDYALRKHY